ncbi:CarD family transcriptional regulator [Bacillus sp. CGMCC 1.16607]|uniref:CarD family transcriptional regulator n=1 Tax=Bacillus sp. CGMCC 1.16607 TaxID=3351842 RepID=UPI003643CB5A
MEVDSLFQIGDNIVYPMHGAGKIVGIEEKEIQGKIHQYYVIKMPSNNMQVMIPMDKILKSHIRLVSDIPTLKEVLLIFKQDSSDRSLTWKQRYQVNMDKMRTGKIQEGAEVIRDLIQINKEKSLNSSEKQMLENAKKIFISELGLIKHISEIQANDLLDSAING